MQKQALRRAELHRTLGEALPKGEFSLVYQPQVVAPSSRLVGLEALLRWDSPIGSTPPSEFIPVAEEHGLMGAIGEWVLRTACKQFMTWKQDAVLNEDVILAVNVSTRQLTSGGLLETLQEILNEFDMEAGSLELEITETAMIGEAANAVTELEKINALGIRVALDDFGTGYSSLNYLKQLPVQTLKIDRSFVRDAVTGGSNADIVTGTLALANIMGLTTIAEGVETTRQMEFLTQNRCPIMQGFLFSRPMSAALVDQYLTDQLRGERLARLA